MLIQALTDPGDVLLTEEYVYLGTMRQMRLWSAQVVGVKCDEQGLIPEALDETIRAQAAGGRRVKFLYTIPTFQNPLGWTMTLERRQRTLEICQSHGVPVLEDDCYVDLRFEGEDVTSMGSMDDSGQVLYVGSMSKIIAPGVRMGYLVAPEEVRQRALSFKSGGVNQFAALAIEEYLRNHMYDHIDEENQALRVKRDAMLGPPVSTSATAPPGTSLRRLVRLANDAGRRRPGRPTGAIIPGGSGILQRHGCSRRKAMGRTWPGCASAIPPPKPCRRASQNWRIYLSGMGFSTASRPYPPERVGANDYSPLHLFELSSVPSRRRLLPLLRQRGAGRWRG